jgi:hypothetical protein
MIMKKFTAVIIVIAAVLVAVGIGMVAVSWALSGGGTIFNNDFQKIGGVAGTVEVKTIEASADTLREIEISMTNVAFEVSSGGDKVVITYPENSRYTYEYSQTADKILLKEHSKRTFWFFGDLFNWSKEATTVTIEIPDTLRLSVLDLSSVNGKMSLDGIAASRIDLEGTNGDVALNECEADALKVGSTNGSFTVTACFVKGADFSTVNGSLSVEDSDIVRLGLDTVNGGLTATGLPGKATDYTLKIDMLNGGVTVNGVKVSQFGGYNSLTTGERTIEVDSINGSVRLETMEE